MIFFKIKYRWITLLRDFKDSFHSLKIKRINQKKKEQSIKTLKVITKREVLNNSNEIRLFAIMRNESLRLPHFLTYYKELGVDRFFFIDNNSTDNSIEIALKADNVHVFSTSENYQNHWYWMEHLLETYGKNHWCVVVDIDELFSFPYSEKLSIRDLIKYLDEEKSCSICTFLLDMYSDKSVISTDYSVGLNPLNITTYFDRDYRNIYFPFFDRLKLNYFTAISYTGGMRERVFGVSSPPHFLSKIPLFKNIKGSYLAQGMHAINGSKTSKIQGVVFHTKFLFDFIEEVKEETIRGHHYGGAFYYKHFATQIDKNSEISFYNENSIKYINSEQLVELGIMKTNDSFDKFAKKVK